MRLLSPQEFKARRDKALRKECRLSAKHHLKRIAVCLQSGTTYYSCCFLKPMAKTIVTDTLSSLGWICVWHMEEDEWGNEYQVLRLNSECLEDV